MRRPFIALLLACLAALPPAASAQQPDGYAMLIVSRDRLALATLCDIGVYLQDELAARLMPGEEAAFNLPPGALSHVPANTERTISVKNTSHRHSGRPSGCRTPSGRRR